MDKIYRKLSVRGAFFIATFIMGCYCHFFLLYYTCKKMILSPIINMMSLIKLSKTTTRIRSSAISYSPEMFGDIDIVKKFESFNSLTPENYTSLIHLFNDACAINIVNERSGVILPSDVGTIQVVGVKYKKKFNYKTKQIDNSNIHTDGYVFKIIKRHYTQIHKKRDGTITFKLYKKGNSYNFKTTAGLRKLLYNKIKSGKFGHFIKLDQLNAND